ncbi:MAG: YkgJ family cysteine cluster protein, partial [Spirochaetes bacterium]
VYDYRPLQCRSYPFWGSNLISETAWNELEKNCPGVNKGKLHTKEQIERWLEIIEEESLVAPL